jgi:hypothetical protein
MAKRVVRHLFPLVAAVILAACGGGGGDTAPNVNSALSGQSAATASPSAPSPNPTTTQSASRSVTLDWNPNTEQDLAGYKIYVTTASGAYGGAFGTAPANATSFVVNGLQPGVTYFFVITSFDTSGNESVRSAEVSATTSL